MAILKGLYHLDLAPKNDFLHSKMAKMLFGGIVFEFFFSTRSTFDGQNRSICIGPSPQNLKNTPQKTVQQMFKSVAAWSLKSVAAVL